MKFQYNFSMWYSLIKMHFNTYSVHEYRVGLRTGKWEMFFWFKGLFLNNLYTLLIFIVHTLRYANSYIARLCACLRALIMDKNPAQYCKVYFVTTPKGLMVLFPLLFFLSGCSAGPQAPTPISEQGELEAPAPSLASLRPSYIIQPGDKLDIKFYYNNELNDAAVVRPDGRISLQLVHEVQAASLTTSELASVLKEKYSPHLRDPEISVLVRSFDSQKVYVDGEVGKPGMVDIGGYLTLLQSIASAGGLKDSARGGEVLIIRRNNLKKPFVLKVDVDAAMDGTDITQDIVLEPYDIVYVPKSAIANVNTFVDLYIRRNIPISLNYGFYRSLD